MNTQTEVWTIGMPWSESDELSYPDGAHSSIDYRSLIHDVVSRWSLSRKDHLKFDFNAFFAATDAILDAQHALFAAERHVWPTDGSERSLWLYGSLQALTIERDCVIQVLSCFSIESTDFKSDTQEINEIRVRVAGHPADHRRGQLRVKGVSFVSRLPGVEGRFTIGTFRDDPQQGRYLPRDIDVIALIRRQSLAVNRALSKAWIRVKPDWQREQGLRAQ